MARKPPPKKKAAKTKSTGKTGTFEELFSGASPEVRAIAERLRAIVYEVLPNATELVYTGGWKIALFREPTEVCGIQPAGDRCNFYLTHGAHLDDPDGLLEGTGKSIRHVKVRSADAIPAEGIQRLIRQGKKTAREAAPGG